MGNPPVDAGVVMTSRRTASDARPSMVTHLVLLKPRTDLPLEARRALVDAFERASRAIPDVRAVRVGRRLVHGAGYETSSSESVEYLVLIDFDDLAGLQAYLSHTAHDELGTHFNQSVSSALVFDFEVGDLDALRRLAE